jgi:hypothetical protein
MLHQPDDASKQADHKDRHQQRDHDPEPNAWQSAQFLGHRLSHEAIHIIERLASRSQIKHSHASHHQQPQNDSRSDELDPFLIVREPSMHAIHGQPPSGYHASSN